MADGRLEKLENRHISPTIKLILTKFGVVMHLGFMHQSGCYKFMILKSNIADVLVNTLNCCGALFKGVKWLLHWPATTPVVEFTKKF